ncbi:MAG: substrate-binding domain-containing protein [Planctomycetes bacterium]|nr:substrate-binding domain-containing protein [Planctomycetota bacterium]
MRFSKRLSISLISLFLIIPVACKQKTENKDVILATTTSVNDTGVLDVLMEKFRQETGFNIKPIAVGSGEAMAMGKRGDADVLVVHSPKDEEAFMKEGFGKNRLPVMYNYFIIVGPPEDPAGCAGGLSASEAFKKIAETKSIFVSRADKSGTHKKELDLWANSAITPIGDWYIKSQSSMATVLQITNDKNGYTLTDKATYLAFKSKLSSKIIVENSQELLNIYCVITVNQEKFSRVNYEGAFAWLTFLLSADAQKLIGGFGKDKYGEPLFYPVK